MKYMVDIDGTICSIVKDGDYTKSQPHKWKIDCMNDLYERGHEIHYWTARGMNSGRNWEELTKKQFEEWGVKYTSLNFNKPSYDLWIDDKCMNQRDYFGVEL